jgi:hypothetical protein
MLNYIINTQSQIFRFCKRKSFVYVDDVWEPELNVQIVDNAAPVFVDKEIDVYEDMNLALSARPSSTKLA